MVVCDKNRGFWERKKRTKIRGRENVETESVETSLFITRVPTAYCLLYFSFILSYEKNIYIIYLFIICENHIDFL